MREELVAARDNVSDHGQDRKEAKEERIEMFRAAAAVNNSLGQIIRQEHVLARFKFLEKMIAFQKKSERTLIQPRYFVSKVISPHEEAKCARG